MRVPLPLLLLLAGCATAGARSEAAADPLALYAEAYGWGALAFSCYPALYAGGPGHPRYERMRRALHQRRLRIRGRLIQRHGAERIEAIEREQDEQEHGIYRTGCDVDETARARLRYRRLLRRLEREAGPGPNWRRL